MGTANIYVGHTLEKLSNAVVQYEPCEHIEVDDIFEPYYFEQIKKHVPPYHMFRSVSGHIGVYRLDLVVDKSGGGDWSIYDFVSPTVRDFWTDFVNVYMGHDLIHALLSIFGIDNLQKDNNIYMPGRVALDKKHAGIGPHLDRPDKVLGCIFHIPLDKTSISKPECGTLLLRPKDHGVVFDSHRHYKFEDFDVAKIIEYKPNKLFVFRRTDTSYHGYNQSLDVHRVTIKTFVQLDIDPNAVRAKVDVNKEHANDWRT